MRSRGAGVTARKKALTCGSAASARGERGRGRRTSGAAVVRDRAIGEDALRLLGCLLGRYGSGVRENQEGRQGRKKRERVGRPTGFGLGFRFGFPLFYFLFQTPLKLKPFEFKFKFEFNPSTQTKRTMHQHECNNKF